MFFSGDVFFFVLLLNVIPVLFMVESSSHSSVYSKNTLEFLAVAKSYCEVLENPEQLEKDKLLEILLRLLPLLYLKGSLLPSVDPIEEDGLETCATEMQYGLLAGSLAALFGEEDTYLEVYHPDIALADGAFAASVSERLADLWQEMYDFVEVFRQGYEDAMCEVLYLCKERFAQEWGPALLHVLRALHAIKYEGSGAGLNEAD